MQRARRRDCFGASDRRERRANVGDFDECDETKRGAYRCEFAVPWRWRSSSYGDRVVLTGRFVLLLLIVPSLGFSAEADSAPYAHWRNGLPSDAGYFPIAVWLQSPRNADRYKA